MPIFCDANASKPITQPKLSGGGVYYQSSFDNAKLVNPYIIGSWYLTEIDDSLTNRKILFNYVTRNVNNPAGSDVSYNQSGDYTIISHKNSINTTPEISSIVYPDGHTVTFNYGGARIDLNGENVLSTVDIAYAPPGGTSRMLSEFQLNTTYFIRSRYGTPTTAQQKNSARLCLRSVKKIAVDLKEDSPPYIFDYYLGSGNGVILCHRLSFYAKKDYWGFYNGSNSVPYDNDLVHNTISLTTAVTQLNNDQPKGLCFLNNSVPGQVYLNPKSGYAQNGLLKQIIYPTGGTLSYSYVQNTATLSGSSVATTVGGVHVSQTSSTDGGNSNGCGTPITTQYKYVLSDETTSSLWGMESPVNSMVLQSHYNSEQKKYHWTWSCAPFGCCYWNFQYPGILSQLEAVDLMGLQKFMNTIGPALGVLTVVTDVLDVLNLIFVSTGVLAWVAVIVDIVGGLVTLGITCLAGDNSKDNSCTIFYNADLNGSNPLPAQFKQVEVTESRHRRPKQWCSLRVPTIMLYGYRRARIRIFRRSSDTLIGHTDCPA